MKRFKITGKHLPQPLTTAATVMAAVALNRCMKQKDVDKLDLVIRFKHHTDEGETFFLGKNKYEIIVDHHRITHDSWGREYEPDERIAKIVNLIGHEVAHIWQYHKGDLKIKNKKLYHKGIHYHVNGNMETRLQRYMDLPYEKEARGEEEGHMLAFLIKWKQLQTEGIV